LDIINHKYSQKIPKYSIFLEDYYDIDGDNIFDQPAPGSILCDPEYVEYACLDHAQVDALLEKAVAELLGTLPQQTNGHPNLAPSLAKLLLHLHEWDGEKVKAGYLTDSKRFLNEVNNSIFPII
jgi:hypothetical protein